MNHKPLLAPALALLASCLFATPALAAESYDNCAGTISTLPAVIGTQGVWCLKKDLATLSASGNAITVSAPNVTLDCNGFKLGGLAAGTATEAIGINASGYSNFTVRGCNIRGFATGLLIDTTSGGGHLVEDNRFDGNTRFGIYVFGDGSLIRRNQVLDTGGSTGPDGVRIAGIYAEGNIDILDNTVRVVDGSTQDSYVYGIILLGASSGTIIGNRVSGLEFTPGWDAFSIRSYASYEIAIRDNSLNGPRIGIACSTTDNAVVGNLLMGFATPLSLCPDNGNTIVQ